MPTCLTDVWGCGLWVVEGTIPIPALDYIFRPGSLCCCVLLSVSVVAVAHPKEGGMGLSVRKSRRDGFESRPGAYGSLKIQGRNFE